MQSELHLTRMRESIFLWNKKKIPLECVDVKVIFETRQNIDVRLTASMFLNSSNQLCRGIFAQQIDRHLHHPEMKTNHITYQFHLNQEANRCHGGML